MYGSEGEEAGASLVVVASHDLVLAAWLVSPPEQGSRGMLCVHRRGFCVQLNWYPHANFFLGGLERWCLLWRLSSQKEHL